MILRDILSRCKQISTAKLDTAARAAAAAAASLAPGDAEYDAFQPDADAQELRR